MMKFTLRVQRLEKPELVAYDRILKRYGSGCYPQEVQEMIDHWRVPIGVYLPSKVVNEKTNITRFLTFNFKDVGQILIKKSTLRVETATRLGTLTKNIADKKGEIRKLVEKDLVKVFGKPEMELKFSALRFSLTGLQPIYRTLSHLLQEDYPNYDDLVSIGRHYPEQIELIVDLDYAKYTETNVLLPTNKLQELFRHEKGNMERTIDIVLGMVLSTFYFDLRKSMRVAQFVPYVRASTAYYGDAVQFGKLVSISKTRLRANMRNYYRGTPLPASVRYAHPVIVRELVNANILDFDGQYITGTEAIFEELIDIRNELPISEESFYS